MYLIEPVVLLVKKEKVSPGGEVLRCTLAGASQV